MILGGFRTKRSATRRTARSIIKAAQAPLSPSAVAALQADALAQHRASLAEVRLADQRRFDAIGLPRYAYPEGGAR